MTAPTSDALEQQLLLLFRAARTSYQELAREIHPALDPSAYGILYLVASGTATTITSLAQLLAVGKPTVSRQVSVLQGLGLVVRTPTGDRTVRVALTEEGLARFELVRHRRQQQFQRLLATWTPRDQSALTDLLTRFNALPWLEPRPPAHSAQHTGPHGTRARATHDRHSARRPGGTPA